MSRLPKLEGYRTLSPSELESRGFKRGSRSVITPSGAVISRRQWENLRLITASPWASWSEYQRARVNPRYQFFAGKALDANDELEPKDLASPVSEFNRLYREAMPLMRDRKSAGYRDPEGPVAKFLVLIGFRDESDTHNVGETGL